MIEAVIVSTGDELTRGQTVDTNGAWIAGQLWRLGIHVRRIITGGDQLLELSAIIKQAVDIAPVVIGTGGLGPTQDDLTRQCVAMAFGVDLQEHPGAKQQVAEAYRSWGREVKAGDQQVFLPAGSRVLKNSLGSAPGFSLQVGRSTVYWLPGVPHEMKEMYHTQVKPDITGSYQLSPPHFREIGVVMAESEIQSRLAGMQTSSVRLGYQVSPEGNRVKLLFEQGLSTRDHDRIVGDVQQRLSPNTYGCDGLSLHAAVALALTSNAQTLAIAESCTAGQICARLASIPGASAFLNEGAVVYTNAAKVARCGVSEQTLRDYGAVSAQVVCQMASGIRDRSQSSWGLAVSGIAGPTGGSKLKPIGTVHMAVAGPNGVRHVHHKISGGRDLVTARAATQALLALYQCLTM